MKTVLSFFDRGYLKKTLLILLAAALLPFADILLILYLGNILGTYLVLAAVAATSLAGLFLGYGILRKLIITIKERVRDDELPEKEFLSLAAAVPGSFFLICPGFLTDCLGLVLFLPGVREKAGQTILKMLGIPPKEVYEYLKLYE